MTKLSVRFAVRLADQLGKFRSCKTGRRRWQGYEPTRRRLAVVRGVGLRQAARVADMAADIASAAAADPHTHGRLLDAISRTGQVGGAHRNLMVSRRAAEIAAEPPPLPDGPVPRHRRRSAVEV